MGPNKNTTHTSAASAPVRGTRLSAAVHMYTYVPRRLKMLLLLLLGDEGPLSQMEGRFACRMLPRRGCIPGVCSRYYPVSLDTHIYGPSHTCLQPTIRLASTRAIERATRIVGRRLVLAVQHPSGRRPAAYITYCTHMP